MITEEYAKADPIYVAKTMVSADPLRSFGNRTPPIDSPFTIVGVTANLLPLPPSTGRRQLRLAR